MQKILRIVSAGLSALLLAGTCTMQAASAADTADADTRAGFIKSVRGKVQLVDAAGAARPAAAGDRVVPADLVVTEADSAASLVLRDGTALVVGPSSRFEIKAFAFDSTTQDGGLLVSLARGSLRMVTGLIGKSHPEAVKVETQTATIGIRGTDFIVQADAQP